MHDSAFAFVQDCTTQLPARHNVLEFGGRNINGTVRGLFPSANYTSIDLVDGPGVDVVGDATEYKPKQKPDTVVCTEVLEHAKNWKALIKAAAEDLLEEGILILTCATDPRSAHSAIDGGVMRDKEHYQNIDPGELGDALKSAGFAMLSIKIDSNIGDLYVLAQKQ